MLNHDEDTKRLQLVGNTAKPVTSMTRAEIMMVPMKNGCRPPSLFEVLAVAEIFTEAGIESKLIIEMKPHSDIAWPLAEWFHKNRWAMRVTGVVMSFALELCHTFVRALHHFGIRDEF